MNGLICCAKSGKLGELKINNWLEIENILLGKTYTILFLTKALSLSMQNQLNVW